MIYGSRNKKAHSIEARQIEVPLPASSAVAGSAVIETLTQEDSQKIKRDSVLLRADGYWIRIDAQTEISWDPSLHTLDDVRIGDWIDYKGKENGRGMVVASSVKLTRVVVGKGEEKLRAKYDFDPAAVPASAKQSTAGMAFTGIDPKRFPAYNDPAMQARIDEIGEKLIPSFQRDLSDSDPARIHFRFQLIDTRLFRDALTLPSGVILIPRQVVERMQNDSQLATVLADNIACAFERQSFRAQPKSRAANAAFFGGAFVPFAGPAIQLGSVGSAAQIYMTAAEQSGRVSLGLLHDAGYDIDQAPIAWWLLASKNPRPISEIPLPARSANLYRILGEVWHNAALASAPDTSQAGRQFDIHE